MGKNIVQPDSSNTRGIPRVIFVEDVAAFIDGDTIDDSVKEFSELFSKYKYMERSLLLKKASLETKVPEIRRSLDTVEFMITKRDSADGECEIDSRFEISDSLYANAKANVMVEYSLEEAQQLLAKNLDAAERQLQDLNKDLEFLNEQLTTTQVNISRIYNHGVRQRQIKTKA